jgi:transcriptional regulator with XRE-family HTH domain
MKSTLPQRLERIFTDLGVNQIDLARRTGFGQSYISQILAGYKSNPSERFYLTVSREFNVNPEWLKTGKGDVYFIPDGNGQNIDAEILAKYRLLPLQEQRIIEDMINALLVKQSSENM